MAYSRGPDIVKNGLIAHYDGANIKSFRGEPTTNLLSNPVDMTQWGGQQITVESTPSAYHIIDSRNIPFYKVTSTSTTDPYHKADSPGLGVVSGRTFSFSIWAYTDEGQSDFAQVFIYGSNPFSASTVSANTYTLTTEPQKYDVTTTFADDVSNTQLSTRIDLNEDASLGYIYVGAAQLEEKSAPTKFIEGTRGTTVATGGGLFDISRNENHSTLYGNPSFNEDNYGSISFDGVSDYARSNGDLTNYPSGISQPFTVETWIRVPSSATWTNGSRGNIIGRGSYAGSHGLVRHSTDNTISSWLRGTTSGIQEVSGTITRDEWYHCAISWDGSTSALYIDGESQGTDSTAIVGGIDTGISWKIAEAMSYSGAKGNAFDGEMTSIKFYNRALSDDEVLQNYDALKSRFK